MKSRKGNNINRVISEKDMTSDSNIKPIGKITPRIASQKPNTEKEDETSNQNEINIVNGQIKSSEHDPIRVYLHEIAGHSLLSREEEISISKKIEKGKQLIARAIIECPIMIRQVINLGEKLQKGTLNIRDVTDLDDDNEVKDEDILYGIRKSITAITKLYLDNEKLANKIRTSSNSRKKPFLKKLKINNDIIVSHLAEINLNSFQMERIINVAKNY
ncbi:MAG: sigma-70 factor domain-containing protein, partial [Thermodesulfobacteriota bacterium]